MAEEAVAIQQSLAGLNRTMSTHMEKISNSTVSFREAAAQHNKNVSNVVKDVFSAIAGQRRELSETNDNLEESFSGIKQGLRDNARSTDAVNDAMQQVLSVQYKTLGELSLLNRNMNSLLYNTSGGVLGEVFGKIFGDSWLGRLSATFTNSLRTILPIGLGVGAAAIAGGGGPDAGALGPGLGESGSSSEAMSFFQSKGWTKEQSAGIVGNLQTESGKNLRTNAVGDNGQAYGIAQWHPDRQAKFQQVMGIPIRQSNFKQQLEFVQWELTNSEQKAGQMLKSATTAIEAARAVDYGYERSTHEHLGRRMANAVALSKGQVTTPAATTSSAGSITPTTPTTSTTNNTTNVTNTESPDPGRQALPAGAPSAVGPVGNYKREENREQSVQPGVMGVSLPKSDIVALGNALQQQGLRISEHPQFGGVSGVHKGRAHYEGRAIDINVGTGVTEASDPAIGAKFDKLADQLTSAGYKVYWRESGKYGAAGHNNHLHAEILPGGKTPDTAATPTTPTGQVTPTTPATPGLAPTAAAQQSPGMTNFQEFANQKFNEEVSMVSQLGIPGMMGGGMGMAGIMGMIGPMFNNLGSQIEGIQQPTNNTAGLLQAAAIEEKVIQSMQYKPTEIEQRETDPSQFMQSPERHFPAGSYSEYNTDNHLYPDWWHQTQSVYGSLTGANGGNIKTHI